MFNSLRTLVAFRYSLLFGLLSLSIAVGIYMYLERDAYGRLDETSKTVLGVLAVTVNHEIEEHGGKQDGERSLREVLNTMYQTSFPQEQIAVWEGDRLVAYKGSLGRHQEDLRAVRFSKGSQIFNHRDLRIATSQVYSPTARTVYRLAVSVWRGDTQNDLNALSYGLELVIPLALILAAAAGFFVANRTLAPLADMARIMDAITSKTLNERIVLRNSHNEIGRLATRFNQLLERLQNSFQQQRRFMADASHELRTPVAAALTAAQITARDPHRSPEQYREALIVVEEQMKRLRRIVDDMFLLARADSDSMRLQNEDFYFDELVDESCRAMRVLAERSA